MTDRRTLRSALHAYVRGHDRGWTDRQKLEGMIPQPEPEPEFGVLPESPRFGLPVPGRLDFRRGPDTWRDRTGEGGGPGHG